MRGEFAVGQVASGKLIPQFEVDLAEIMKVGDAASKHPCVIPGA